MQAKRNRVNLKSQSNWLLLRAKIVSSKTRCSLTLSISLSLLLLCQWFSISRFSVAYPCWFLSFSDVYFLRWHWNCRSILIVVFWMWVVTFETSFEYRNNTYISFRYCVVIDTWEFNGLEHNPEQLVSIFMYMMDQLDVLRVRNVTPLDQSKHYNTTKESLSPSIHLSFFCSASHLLNSSFPCADWLCIIRRPWYRIITIFDSFVALPRCISEWSSYFNLQSDSFLYSIFNSRRGPEDKEKLIHLPILIIMQTEIRIIPSIMPWTRPKLCIK